MKKLLAILVLLLLAATALAEPMSYLDYTDDILEDGSLIYYFPELSLQLPGEWRGRVMALVGRDGTSFYQRASYEKYLQEDIPGGGFLFKLGISVNGSFSTLPAFRYLGYSEASSLNYYLELPTDYPAYMQDDIRAEYDAMSAKIDYVAEHARFYDAPAAEPAPEPEPEPTKEKSAAVSLEKARYHFEHSAMPRFFYENPENIISVISQQGPYPVWVALISENGVDSPYRESDFDTRYYTAQDGTEILQVLMPEPTEDTMCYRLYFVYNPQKQVAGYYTVEYEGLLGPSAMLCGWTEDRQHVNYGGAAPLGEGYGDYEASLIGEAHQVAKLAGVSTSLTPLGSYTEIDDGGSAGPAAGPVDTGLAEIACPEQGFITRADPDYAWEFDATNGLTIYTGEKGVIPYVMVFRSEDLVVEAFEYIQEQYTPHMKQKYGESLVNYEEYEAYSLGGKTLPAGVYTYLVQGVPVDMIRAYDSTGDRTVVFTAKYIQGQAEPTLTALNDAIRNFQAQ